MQMKSIRGWWVPAGLGVVAIALASCGESDDRVAQNGDPITVPVQAQAAVATAALHPATLGEGEVVATSDSLPPEIEVEVADRTVTPGKAIEITAIGSEDVREMMLTDGRGKATSFVYDLPSRSWKAYYRVPMKPSSDRLGLSVTAKNEGRRWRRVWLFLDVRNPEIATASGSATPDSVR
jgi:hypothetical protein